MGNLVSAPIPFLVHFCGVNHPSICLSLENMNIGLRAWPNSFAQDQGSREFHLEAKIQRAERRFGCVLLLKGTHHSQGVLLFWHIPGHCFAVDGHGTRWFIPAFIGFSVITTTGAGFCPSIVPDQVESTKHFAFSDVQRVTK